MVFEDAAGYAELAKSSCLTGFSCHLQSRSAGAAKDEEPNEKKLV
jgi:hypothetical protein